MHMKFENWFNVGMSYIRLLTRSYLLPLIIAKDFVEMTTSPQIGQFPLLHGRFLQ